MSSYIAATGQVDLLASVGDHAAPLRRAKKRRGTHPGGATSYDIVKSHLASGKVISPSIAMATYEMSTGSLSAVISRLRGELKWQIASVPITDEHGNRSVSYQLIKPAPVPQAPIADDETNEAPAAVGSISAITIAVRIAPVTETADTVTLRRSDYETLARQAGINGHAT
jgi:hypothetical protein